MKESFNRSLHTTKVTLDRIINTITKNNLWDVNCSISRETIENIVKEDFDKVKDSPRIGHNDFLNSLFSISDNFEIDYSSLNEDELSVNIATTIDVIEGLRKDQEKTLTRAALIYRDSVKSGALPYNHDMYHAANAHLQLVTTQRSCLLLGDHLGNPGYHRIAYLIGDIDARAVYFSSYGLIFPDLTNTFVK